MKKAIKMKNVSGFQLSKREKKEDPKGSIN